MILPCGHVICKESILKLIRGPSSRFKCPYCPAECNYSNCYQVNF